MSFNKGIDYNLSGTLTLGNSNFKYLTNTSYAHLSGTLSASVISGSQITGSQILADRIQSNNFTGSFAGIFSGISAINGFTDVTFDSTLTSGELLNKVVVGVVTGSDITIGLPDLGSTNDAGVFVIFRSGSFSLSLSSSQGYSIVVPGSQNVNNLSVLNNYLIGYYRNSNQSYYLLV